MARRIRNLIGVEIVPSAVECARKNAGKNGIGNARFICEDAENVNRYLKVLLSDSDRPVDAVILDPPRKGCSRELLETLVGSQIGRIVYLSCDPDTLARDIRALSPVYRCSELFPYDMFPRTGHVETVVLMTRTGAGNG